MRQQLYFFFQAEDGIRDRGGRRLGSRRRRLAWRRTSASGDGVRKGKGSFTVICGPSGCGKTTLLALLGALETPTSGHVLFQEQDLANCSDFELARVRRRMGFIFQDHALVPKLSVWKNITYPLIPQGISRAERYDRARQLLDRFGIAR